MADAGSLYYNALSGMGNDIAQSMYQVHKQHQAYDEQYGQAEALSRIGIDPAGRIVPIMPDEKGKVDKSIQPILDPKALEMFKTGNRREWARSAGQLEVLTRLGTSFLNRAQAAQIENQQNPKYDVTTPTGRTIPLSGAGAVAADVEAQRRQDALATGAVREARAGRRENREERTQQREDVRLGMSAAKDMRAELEKRPEVLFSRKYGLTPQAVIGLQESPYVAKDIQGNVIADGIAPVEPGKRLSDLTSKPGVWNDLKSYFNLGDKGKRDTIMFEPKDPSTGTFRESLYKYSPSSAGGKQVPSREQYVVNPTGELLNIRGTRVPLDEVSAVQNAATAAQKDLANTLSSKAFQSFTPEQQAIKLGQIKDRLSTLGYNPNDPFWGLPQQ